MPNNPFGYKMMYPTKTGGFTYFQSSNILNDAHFADEGHVKDSSNYQWTMSTSGPDAVQFGKNDCCDQTVIDGCSANFEETVKRGYMYKSDDPKDVEIQFLVKFVSSGSDNGFAI